MELNKKHVFVFRTATGAMTVGTDDLFELSSQSWFTKFLGVSKQEHQPAPPPPADVEVYDAAALKADVQQMVRAQVNEVAKQMLAERSAVQQPPLPELPPEPPEVQIEDVAKEAEEEFRRAEQEMSRPNIRRDMPGAGKQNFLDITPDKMTEQIWMSLTPEQQQQYGQRYM
jgi:hypothetical protein